MQKKPWLLPQQTKKTDFKTSCNAHLLLIRFDFLSIGYKIYRGEDAQVQPAPKKRTQKQG